MTSICSRISCYLEMLPWMTFRAKRMVVQGNRLLWFWLGVDILRYQRKCTGLGKRVVPRLRESRLLIPSGREFTQPKDNSFAQPSTVAPTKYESMDSMPIWLHRILLQHIFTAKSWYFSRKLSWIKISCQPQNRTHGHESFIGEVTELYIFHIVK